MMQSVTERMRSQAQASLEQLIPLEIEIDQLDFTRHHSNVQCDRQSDGSDLSPEELVSENSIERVSMEMMQAKRQVVPASVITDQWPSEETARLIMNSVLVRDEDDNMVLQSMPDEAILERKRKMRQA